MKKDDAFTQLVNSIQQNPKSIHMVQETTKKKKKASLRNLETQIGKLLKQLATNYSNNYGKNIVHNPKKNERCYTVTARRESFLNFLRPKYYTKSTTTKVELDND